MGLSGGACGQGAWSAEPSTDEYTLKAVMLFNIARFTQWQGAQPPRTVCVLGSDPFGAVLDDVAKLSAEQWHEGSPYEIRRIQRAEEGIGCRIVFVAADYGPRGARTPATHAALAGTGTLSIGDSPHFAETGGMLGFTQEGNKLGFAFNLCSLYRAHIKISSKALRLGRQVDAPATEDDCR